MRTIHDRLRRRLATYLAARDGHRWDCLTDEAKHKYLTEAHNVLVELDAETSRL